MSASVEEDPFFSGKKSRMTSTLLSNYVLSISLLKNIARHFTNPADFQKDFPQYINELRRVERSLYSVGSIDGFVGRIDD